MKARAFGWSWEGARFSHVKTPVWKPVKGRRNPASRKANSYMGNLVEEYDEQILRPGPGICTTQEPSIPSSKSSISLNALDESVEKSEAKSLGSGATQERSAASLIRRGPLAPSSSRAWSPAPEKQQKKSEFEDIKSTPPPWLK